MSEGGVTYSVKELIGMLERTLTEQLDKISYRLDGIDKKLDDKAANDRVRVIEERVGLTEGRISSLELSAAGITAVTKFQRWALGLATVIVSSGVGTLLYLLAGGGR